MVVSLIPVWDNELFSFPLAEFVNDHPNNAYVDKHFLEWTCKLLVIRHNVDHVFACTGVVTSDVYVSIVTDIPKYL